MVNEVDLDGAPVTTWRRQARPVEVAIWTVDDRHAWALRLRGGAGTIEQGVEDDFQDAALRAELAKQRHERVDWLRTW